MAFAQIALGKDGISPISTTNNNPNPSILLEFGTDPKGIILPSVTGINNPNGGTFAFNQATKKVEVYEGYNNSGAGGWTSLTEKLKPTDPDGVANPYINTGADNTTQGVLIGNTTSTKHGVLILESTTKAMVLPKVKDPQLLRGAVAGTMVYDTTSDTLAIYDGTSWSFWK